LSFLFAWRYFKAKKSTNAINIISWVSVAAVILGTASLIVVLSVFNGLEQLVRSLYSSFYADVRVSPVSGKFSRVPQATLAKLYKLHAANQGFRLYRRALVMENKWRAARYGINGKMIDWGKQKEVPIRDLILEYLDFVDDVVDELDSREEINYIRQILETGNGADRQLRVFEQTGDLKKVVDYIIEETEVGLAESSVPHREAKVS